MADILSPSKFFFGRQRILRRQRGWSVAELASRLASAGFSISRQMITKQEAGQVDRVSLDQAAAAAQVFEVPIETLVTGSACMHCQGSPPSGFTCQTCGTS